MKKDKFYLVNDYMPVISNMNIIEVKKSLISYYNFLIYDIKEIDKFQYDHYLKHFSYKKCPLCK